MAFEKTLVLIKPPCSNMTSVAIRIFMAYINAGLQLTDIKDIVLQEQFLELYGEHQGKPFFKTMEKAYLGEDFTAICFQGEDVIQKVRELNGPTNPLNASPMTIRGVFGDKTARKDGFTTPYNAVHGSDSPENAQRELKIFFPEYT